MAITRAQQVRQMLEDGGMLVQPSTTGKRPGYRSAKGMASKSASSKSSSKGRDRDFQQRGASKSDYATTSQSYKDSGTQQVYDGSKNTSPRDSFVPTTPSETPKAPPKKPKKTKDNYKKSSQFTTPTLAAINFVGQGIKNSKLGRYLNTKAREDYLENLQITNPELYQETIDDLEKLGYYNPDPVEYYGPESKGAARDIEQFPDLYEDQAKSILNTVRDNFDDEGNATVGTLYDNYLDSRNTTTGGGGGGDQQQTDPCLGPNPPAYCNVGGDDDDDDDTNKRNLGGLAPRFAGSIFDFTGLADGGRAGMMDGGMMSPEGGIMDLESGRQMYFLGKLVKKATRAVKKIAKSPFGKVALGAALFNPAAAGGLSTFLKTKAAPFLFKQGANFAAGDIGLGKLLTGGLTGKGKFALGAGLTLAPFLMGKPKEDDDGFDLDDYYKKNRLNVANIRDNPYDFLAPRFAADGGIMRNGYAEGSEEPVAKKTMPLIDMDGQEMDLRAEGGFVPLGRMERADDVPARLSKNEFVFTADAVRNAGEGDVDKGAEVMYNMMKNLESGGDVSEESQGLDGAREMFKTSQRLEEVI